MAESKRFPGSQLLGDMLEVAVPMAIWELRDADAGELMRIAAGCADVIAGQGDTLMFGSEKIRFGHGARDAARHQEHAHLVSDQVRESDPDLWQRRHDKFVAGKCAVCLSGQPGYSPGEVFSFLARGLACLAHWPGGVDFAGRHWDAGRPLGDGAGARVRPAPAVVTVLTRDGLL